VTEEHQRAADTEIHVLTAKVGQLESESRQHREDIQALGRKIGHETERLFGKLDEIRANLDTKTRLPMLPFVTLLIVAGGFLLTIMTLITSHQGRALESLQKQQTAHHDGHPVWVTELMAEKFKSVLDTINAVDHAHREAENEKEEDIIELRLENSRTEIRNDKQDARLSVLETQVAERTEFFDRHVDLKSRDRWTKTQADERARLIESVSGERHASLSRRIDDLHDQSGANNGGRPDANRLLEDIAMKIDRLMSSILEERNAVHEKQ